MRASARGLISGLIPPVTAVGKNLTVEVRVKDAEKRFVRYRRPELEFSAWTGLLSRDFYPNAALLCRYLAFALGRAVGIVLPRSSGCREAVREGTAPHGASLTAYGIFNPSRCRLMGEVWDSFRSGAE